MEQLFSVIQAVLAFITAITILVFVHEWGHYIVARMNGVKVDVFSIGFGKEIFGWYDKHGTRWRISYIPMGGYVKFFGDASAASTPDGGSLDDMSAEERAVAFHYKKLWQRAAIVFAGPLANFIFAIMILAGFFVAYGQRDIAPVVSEVIAESPAEAAGILAGDVIVSVDDEKIDDFRSLKRYITLNVGDAVNLGILRGDQSLMLLMTPRLEDVIDQDGKIVRQEPRIGIRSDAQNSTYIDHNIFSAIWAATLATRDMVEMTFTVVSQMVVGDRSAKDIGGPIGIAQESGKRIDVSLESFIEFIAIISISLGIINLLPIPLLDGGHLLFYSFEAVLGRKLNERTQELGFRIGLMMVLGLMIFATFNDIMKLVS